MPLDTSNLLKLCGFYSTFSLQLEKRGERRAEAEKLLAQAQEMGNTRKQCTRSTSCNVKMSRNKIKQLSVGSVLFCLVAMIFYYSEP